MKPLKKTRISLLLLLTIGLLPARSSSQDTAIKAEPVVKIRYFVNNRSYPYLLVESALKKGKRYETLPGQQVSVYLDSAVTKSLLNDINTGKSGKAIVIIPASVQPQWNGSSKHNFIAVMSNKTAGEEISEMLEITKARMTIDTSTEDGVRNITVKVMYNDNGEWLPAKDIEMKVGVKRAGGLLSAGEETYTTDSTGMVAAAFTMENLPGDTIGNISITARIEDNELYGNMVVEKTVPWGKPTRYVSGFFDQRTLWSTGFRSPPWLLIMAYSIALIVWGTLIYLVTQIIKIKKLGVKQMDSKPV